MAKQLSEFILTIGRNKGKHLANQIAAELRQILSVQAPVRLTGRGKLVATTRATPNAPPRRISGDLQRSVRVQETAHGARVVVDKPYGAMLERSLKHPHQFFSVVLKKLGIKGRNS